jgi:glycosyltransferase involved in cell wall biosynthesis
MPFVSVIMACRNAESFVGEAIRSVIDQTFTNLELIFIDDNSSDNSLLIAKAFAQSDKRIKVLSNRTSLGAGVSRNLAIEKSTGEWIAILDADDVFIKDKLEKQVAFLNTTRGALVLVGTGCFQIEEDGRRVAVYKYPLTSRALKNRLFRQNAFPPHSSLMYRSSVIRAIGGFNDLFVRAEDFECCLRMSKYGAFACLSEPLIEYRLHNANISNSVGETGYSQLDYAMAASVCDLLRKSGSIDPSSADDQMLWDKLMLHVNAEVKASSELEFREWKRTWRNNMYLKKGQIGRIALGLHQLTFNPANMWRLLSEYKTGSRLPHKCLASWLSKS